MTDLVKRRSLRKSPSGIRLVSNFTLALPWSDNPLDPNGYYKRLGISKHPATMLQVHRAFRDMAREHHPDMGGEASSFHGIHQAYTVLSDPFTRKVYDSLEEGQFWLDDEEVNKRLRKDAERLRRMVAPEDFEEAWDHVRDYWRKQAEAERMMWSDGGDEEEEEVEVEEDGWEFIYFWEDEAFVPPKDIRERWLMEFAEWMWRFGIIDEVNVGFTRERPSIETRPWGTVFLVNPFYPLNGFMVAYMVGEVVKSGGFGVGDRPLLQRAWNSGRAIEAQEGLVEGTAG